MAKKGSETPINTQAITQEDSNISIYKSQFTNPEDAIVSFPLEFQPRMLIQDIPESSKNLEDSSETTSISWMEPKVLNKDTIRKMCKKVPGTYIATNLNNLIAMK